MYFAHLFSSIFVEIFSGVERDISSFLKSDRKSFFLEFGPPELAVAVAGLAVVQHAGVVLVPFNH